MTVELRSSSLLSAPPAGFAEPEPKESARAAGLRYQSDDAPGIRRLKAGRGFSYRQADGSLVRDRRTLERIRGLAIPPAWTAVWISPLANGHLQATGRDARHRKQYRYHADWRAIRDDTKFNRLIAFADALPALRVKVDEDLAQRGLTRERVLATVVRLLETTLIRVGNEEYARENNSYGLTTLRSRHVDIAGNTLCFSFRGKSGKEHSVQVHDRRVARIVRQCRDLPGQELFQYVDEDGSRQVVSSEDVNEYVRQATGESFSAKDFRTWGGTVLALAFLLAQDGEEATRSVVVEMYKQVAAQLGNRPAVCRKYYVHPAVTEAYLSGELADLIPASALTAGLEDATIQLLRAAMDRGSEPPHRAARSRPSSLAN